MAVIGFFAMWGVALLATRKRDGIDRTQIAHIAVCAMAGLFIGAHLLYGVVNSCRWVEAARDGFSRLHGVSGFLMQAWLICGGMVFYGGLFGAIIGAAIYMKVLRLPLAPYMDIMAFCVPLFHGFARIGCFLAGCCYGVEWKYGLVTHNGLEAAANGVPRFPVQLLESGLEFALFAAIIVLYLRRKLLGRLMYVYLLSYAAIRFCDEFLRGDPVRGFVGPLSTSQLISLLVVVTVTAILAVRHFRPKAAAAPSPEPEA